MGPDGTRNQERLCRHTLAAHYRSDLSISLKFHRTQIIFLVIAYKQPALMFARCIYS
jgi:hypothetical protein